VKTGKNNIAEYRSLETEGGQKQQATMNRGFVPYMAKKKIGATCRDMKETRIWKDHILYNRFRNIIQKSVLGGL
jgi:hypothetical protein